MFIFIDLDNTLLDDMWKISNRTIATIKECKKLGHKIVINTARSLYRAIDCAKAINADFINCAWGNLVVDSKGKILFERTFSREQTRKIMYEIKKLPVFAVGLENEYYVYSHSPETARQFNTRLVKFNELIGLKPLKIFVAAREKNRPEIMSSITNLGFDVRCPREDMFCTILPKDSQKYNGIKIILERYASPNEKTMAFGDDIGDLDTFKNVDYPIAMANSLPEVLASTPLRTKSNNEDGVALFLEEFFSLESHKQHGMDVL